MASQTLRYLLTLLLDKQDSVMIVDLLAQLISYKEMLDTATEVCAALKEIPCIGDGDTGYEHGTERYRPLNGANRMLSTDMATL